MKKNLNFIISLAIITALSSCDNTSTLKQETLNQEQVNVSSDTMILIDSQEMIKEADTLLVNEDSVHREPIILDYLQKDSLVAKWYDDLLGIKETNLNFESHKTSKENLYYPELPDTVEVLFYKNSEITIYHVTNSSKSILQCSKIKDSEINISDELHTGLRRKEVEKILEVDFDNDTLEVGNLEYHTVFSLYFKDDILKEIDYCGYLD